MNRRPGDPRTNGLAGACLVVSPTRMRWRNPWRSRLVVSDRICCGAVPSSCWKAPTVHFLLTQQSFPKDTRFFVILAFCKTLTWTLCNLNLASQHCTFTRLQTYSGNLVATNCTPQRSIDEGPTANHWCVVFFPFLCDPWFPVLFGKKTTPCSFSFVSLEEPAVRSRNID